MTHHLLPEIGRDWLDRLTNVFLIREPGEVVPSFIEMAGEPRLEDVGLRSNWRSSTVFGGAPAARRRSSMPAISWTIRSGCCGCCATGWTSFTEAMLSWPAGPRATDGVWAKHWYDAVLKSTTFQPYQPKNEDGAAASARSAERAEAFYQELYTHRLGA